MAAVLSVTLTPCTRPTNCLAFSNTPEILVPLGGLYSIVTANCPWSSTSFNRRGSRLMCSILLLHSHFYSCRRNGARALRERYVPTRPVALRRALSPSEHSFIVRVLRARESPILLQHSRHSLSRLHGVVQQHRNRHRPNTARHRTDPACLLTDRLKIDIATQFTLRSFIRSHIDNDGPFSHHVGRDKLGFPN